METRINLSLAIKILKFEDGWSWQITDHHKKIKHQPKKVFKTPEKAQTNLMEILSKWELR